MTENKTNKQIINKMTFKDLESKLPGINRENWSQDLNDGGWVRENKKAPGGVFTTANPDSLYRGEIITWKIKIGRFQLFLDGVPCACDLGPTGIVPVSWTGSFRAKHEAGGILGEDKLFDTLASFGFVTFQDCDMKSPITLSGKIHISSVSYSENASTAEAEYQGTGPLKVLLKETE